MNNQSTNYTTRYIAVTYISFWCLVGLVAVGFVASGNNPSVTNWGSVIPSWTPTIVLLAMFSKLYPGMTVRDWLRKAFAPRVNLGLLLTVTALLAAATAAGVSAVALQSGQAISGVVAFSWPAVASAVFFSFIQGATGEEAGWRGYLQPVMEKRAGGVIRGSVLVGLVWSFWHTPVWFASAVGLPITRLLAFVGAFIAANLSLAVIIGICFSRCRNLAVPIWIHFASNAFLNALAASYSGDPVAGRCWIALFYVLVAVGFSLWHRASLRRAYSGALPTETAPHVR